MPAPVATTPSFDDCFSKQPGILGFILCNINALDPAFDYFVNMSRAKHASRVVDRPIARL
jgi:hypothetical protein